VCGVRLYVKGGGVVSCCASKVQIAFSKRNKGKWPNGEGSLGDRWKLVIGPIKMKMSDKKKIMGNYHGKWKDHPATLVSKIIKNWYLMLSN